MLKGFKIVIILWDFEVPFRIEQGYITPLGDYVDLSLINDKFYI